MSSFPEPYTHSKKKKKIEAEIDLSDYETKPNLNNATGVGTSDFPKKTDLVDLKNQKLIN